MNFKTFAAFCRKLPHTTEDVKWGSNLVFSVGNKMFALFELPDISHVSFRTTPWLFATLTGKDGIAPAPYLARYNWVLVTNPKALPAAMLKQLLRESYQLVAAGLPAKVRKELGLQEASVSNNKPAPQTRAHETLKIHCSSVWVKRHVCKTLKAFDDKAQGSAQRTLG